MRGREFFLQYKGVAGQTDMAEYVSLADQRRMYIALPPIDQQRAIAQVLGTLDDKIELNRRMNDTLEAIARAIFKFWFVDFDPVRAKAEGRQPPGMDAPTAALFPDRFEDSELGEIPAGWRVGLVSDVADINTWTLSRTDPLPVIDYIEISEVMRGEIENIVRYERGSEPSRARRRLKHGDTVLSTVRPDRGAHFLCLEPPETLIGSTGFAVLSPREGDWAFLYAAVTRHEVGEELGRLADGGAYPAVRPEVVGALPLVLSANPEVRMSFHRRAEPLYKRVALHRAENRTLAALRDTLLPKLVSGELRVKDPAPFLGGVVA
jgi:type I restriction enzyme S subunit